MLDQLFEAAEAIDSTEIPDAKYLRLIQPGSSMGGARPKAAIHEGEVEYLAKFAKETDLVDVPRVEYASMTMLRETALDVPAVRLVPVGKGRSAFLIERFDMRQQRTTHHYVSAHALFNLERVRQMPDGHRDPAGYIALAKHLRGHSAQFAEDCKQLFLRALTNIVIGNTDDHARNFGMRYDLKNKAWGLAPVFDVLPIISGITMEQAMSLGVKGRESSWDNLLSCSTAFELSESDAYALAKDHLLVISKWENYYKEAGVTERDMKLIQAVVKPRLENVLERHDKWR